ncbi:glycoside hydrolase family 31 protein [Flavivirga sp. 57AJ16]|uniref:glycoside hydrolase family 31 protein n=1 Tax=Flavivirga sp. 57AJ16 TaxID=3025307 RepID=UPI0023653EAE|nr:glycoside hydrolase family 31 protein [Flavivirga sp. 57AJ16]MDD7888234.1 glycoside hydrolase family 31 protein [Flavivirga sp. 57AJ16]
MIIGKRLIQTQWLFSFMVLFTIQIFSQQTDRLQVKVIPNEHWWGGAVWDGHIMPFDDGYAIDLYGNNKGNQAQPLLISDKGRVIWSEAPISYSIKGDEILVTSRGAEIKISASGSTLKDAFNLASHNYFPASGKYPDKLLFEKPQYNTWIELIYNQNQKDILKYANAIVENGFSPGVIMIDDNWQEDYGKWDFHEGRFSNPKQMVNELHGLGFKVMLWVCPFVSPDSDVYRDLEKKGYFIKTEKGDLPLIVRWWNGASAVLDFTNPGAVEWFDGQLKELQEKYGIDGYKLDAGDSYFYNTPMTSFNTLATPNDHTYSFQQFGLKYPLNEYRATWKMGGQPLAQRLHDKGHNWNDIVKLIPQITLQGLLGYPFNCPDMIGGGEYGSFIDLKTIDQELIVRSAQVHALMPMMQFSVAPWRVLNEQNLKAVKKAVAIREAYTPIIMELVEKAAKSGEPVVRSMEYEFPHVGFYNIKDQFMLGSNILVAPILEKGATKRLVTLPKGKWTYNGKNYKGGKVVEINVTIEDIPIFQKS